MLQARSNSLESSGFFVAEIDLDNLGMEHVRYDYVGDVYKPHLESSRKWSLPNAKGAHLAPSIAFRRNLEDAGAITHPETAQRLTLQDIYVYPDLRRIHENSRTRKLVSAKNLLLPAETLGGVVLQCDERMGSTSLLYQLFNAYLEQGFAAIIINGRDIKRAVLNHIDDVVNSAIREQYEDSERLIVSQTSRSKKIILVDNIDQSKVVDSSGRAKVLAYLKKLADNIVIVASPNFGLEEILEESNSDELISFEHYEIQPLGYGKRAELVKRWVALSGRSIASADLISECDKAERLIATAMHKSLIPSAPLYLLTLLQSISVGKSADLKESSLGHYYEFLLTEALLAAGVSRSKLNEYYQYATCLAWEFADKASRRITRGELRDFNLRFAEDYLGLDFIATITTLINARILVENGGELEFRYPYMFYHLKGRFISLNLEQASVQAYVQRCCSHLYVRNNANTILFLAHHSNSDWLFNTIKEAMDNIFSKNKPVEFGDDTKKINALVSEAPALIYKGGAPEHHREEKNREMDELDEDEDSSDGLMDKEEPADELSLASQVVMFFKTTEILGQILKNQYSTLKRPFKRNLLEALFDGTFRALGSFYDELGGSSEKFISRVRKAIEEAGKGGDITQRDKLARRFVAEVVQSISVGIIGHAATSVNSEDLAGDIDDAVTGRKTLSYKIIDLAVSLDSSKPIPRSKLESLLRGHKSDLVVSRIIQLLVLGRLYMFKTSETDMRWIEANMNIPITQQHQIAYGVSETKLS